jgi:tetratricopeptide (TPR) repeat protein
MYSKGDQKLLKEAIEILEKVNEEYENDTVGTEHRANALELLLNAYKSLGQIEDARENYIRAIKCGDRLKELLADEPESVIRRYLDNARLFTELSMYKKAEAEYEECERLYPYRSQEIYIGHLRLLLKMKVSAGETTHLYKEALKVEGINENREFRKISERIAYEK